MAFGGTEESILRTIYGCRERGKPADGPFDHRTGLGWVQQRKAKLETYQ